VICPVHGSRAGGSLTVAVRDGDPGLVVHCHAGRNQDILAELRPLGGLWAKGHFRRLSAKMQSNQQSSETEFDLNKYAYRAPGRGSVRREQLTIPEGRPKDCLNNLGSLPKGRPFSS
jgi:hypothetical protein